MVRARRAFRIIASFFLGQGALQGIQILIGLFLVRTLSVQAYAQVGLAFGFQLTMGTLMDFGFTSTIVPLVGDRRNDRQLVGRYVRAAKHLRDRSYWILAPFATLAFLAIMHKHHWSWSVQIVLVSSVLLTLYASGRISYFSAPLFLFGRLRDFYFPQTITALGRLIAYLALGLARVLSAWMAVALFAVNIAINGAYLEKSARKFMDWPDVEDSSMNREVIRYILPATPAIVFAAFQAQISLFLISIFGGTTNIAEVAALGRVGQLFAVLMTFNVVVVEPYIARLPRERLLLTYLGIIAATTALCIPVVLLGFAFPRPILWLLGGHYQDLGSEVGWVVLAACINHLGGLMWIMNRSRRWLFWSGTILEIVLLLSVQAAFLILIGVHTTQQAVFFTFASSFCYVIAHGYVGVYGFLTGSRKCEAT